MKTTTISSPYFVSYYHKVMKRKKGMKRGTISDRKEVLRLLSVIWKTVEEHYLDNEGGVYIDNIGYLCHMLVPGRKFFISRLIGDVCRIGTNGHKYNHVCLDFGDAKRYYHLEISDYLKTKSKRKMKRGKRYRFMYNEVMAKRQIFKNYSIKRVFDDKSLNHKRRTR